MPRGRRSPDDSQDYARHRRPSFASRAERAELRMRDDEETMLARLDAAWSSVHPSTRLVMLYRGPNGRVQS